MTDEELFSVEINKHNLDEEWLVHPQKVKEISRLVANAERERDYKKFDLEVLEAELDKVAREEGGIKTTEAAIKNWIKLRPEWQRKSKEVIDSNHNLKVLVGAANARSHCKYTLENVSRLWAAEYYGEPYNPQLTEAIVERQINKINQKSNRTMLRRKKQNEEKT